MRSLFVIKYSFLGILFIFSIEIFAAQNKNAELIAYNTKVNINNSKLTRFLSYEIQINNRAGEQYSEVSIPFSSLVKVSNIHAFIKTPEGKIIKKLSKNDITERNSYASYSFYEDQFVKEFTLKHNQYPYIIHVEYEEKEEQFVYADYWNPILNIDVATREASLSIEAPKNYNINFYNQNAIEISRDSTDFTYIYNWKATFDGNIKTELYSPPLQNYVPVVIAVPENFNYELNGSFASWKSYGTWLNNLIQNLSNLPESEINKVKSLVYGIESKEEIIKTLYHYLQDETRYINISLETGGLKPYPASYVAQNKFGDCKALTNYFKAVLKSVDINSYYSTIYAGGVIQKVKSGIPSQQSNHVILCVPDNTDTLWVDCTSKDPFNYCGTFIQNREVFVINGNNSFFSKTPALQPENVLRERKVDLQMEPGNRTIANFITTYRGKQFEILHQLNNSYNEKDKEKKLRDMVIENSFEPLSINIQKVDRDSAKAILTYSARSSEVFKEYGNDLLIRVLSFAVPEMEKPADRKFPIQIDYPIYQKDELLYHIPPGFATNAVLHNTIIDTKYGKYEINSESTTDGIVIRKSFLLKNGTYSLDEYNDFYEFMKSVYKLEGSTYLTISK